MTACEKLIYTKGAPLKAGVWDGSGICMFLWSHVYNTYINITGRCDRYDLRDSRYCFFARGCFMNILVYVLYTLLEGFCRAAHPFWFH